MASWKEWKRGDIIFGIIVPTLVALLIIAWLTVLAPVLLNIDPSYALNAILVDGLGEAILIVGIPMFLGLLWNQWAGGASGFLLGSVYALYVNDQWVFYDYSAVGDISIMGYVICAMLTGYMAGALNRGSFSFRRMVIAALLSSIIAGLIMLFTFVISPLGMTTDIPYNLFIILLPRVIYSIIIPIFATLFNWFGIIPRHMG